MVENGCMQRGIASVSTWRDVVGSE